MKTKSLKDIYTGRIYGHESLAQIAAETRGKLVFFSIDKVISPQELAEAYISRGLVPASPLALARWCEKNQEKNSFYATQWKYSQSGYCYAAFVHWEIERHAHIYRCGSVWRGGWSFAGVRNKSHKSPKT